MNPLKTSTMRTIRPLAFTPRNHRTLHTTLRLQNGDKAHQTSSNPESNQTGSSPTDAAKQAEKSHGGARPEPQGAAPGGKPDDPHPAKQADIQEKPSRSTGYGPQEEVAPAAEGSQKNLGGDKD